MAGATQVRDVGTVFLLKRPLIVAPGVFAGITMLIVAGVRGPQLTALVCLLCGMFLLFCIEAWYGRRNLVSESWLLWSLRLTVTALCLACALSGGLHSPFLPLTFAPVVVAFAAFGRRRSSITLAAYFTLLLVGLALMPVGTPWAPIPTPFATGMTAVTAIIGLVLAYVGVAQLSDSLLTSREALIRTREDALLAATDRLETMQAIGAKVAHELKNPLASIKGLAQLSLRAAEREPEDSGSRTRQRFEVLLTAAAHMEDVVNAYASFDRPLELVELQETDVDALLSSTLELAGVLAESAGVTVTREGTAGTMAADRGRLREALVNVVTNAIEASASGDTVCVRSDRTGDQLTIEVIDQGPGLSEADLQRIGTPYFTTKETGTGLGVLIATTAVRQHGGALTFESRPGSGTRAVLTLPAQPSLQGVPCPV